ncbi:ATP-binding protein [Pseudomonas vlassakiae]|jgi:hypothetical protein|uniref:ATP-binding protein n=1 Tax=Pseudomonas TaxID=286 RepID=UPI000C190518|nr:MULTISPECIES: ATP-binding protein [unclassified Pseudomonas]AXQ47796.1 ATP-binding protein [Stenotrophomonas rhizophila]MBS3184642.1 ATP-binding protein [Pseudomonas sp. PCH44]PIK78448.1 hypothetical protein CQW31_11550 [Pseudomonas sp. 382]
MDPITNPYSPGAGAPPPALAGRDALRRQVNIAIARIRRGRAAKSVLMVGLRGVGKTVLLEKMRVEAEAEGVHAIRMEAPENRSLHALLAPQLRLALLRLSRVEAARDLAQRGLRALAGFAKSLKVTYADIEVGLDLDPEPGLADNGDLESDLATLLEEAGKAAQRADTALVMFIDELQYVAENQLAALITALHRCAQGQLPVTLVGAGLPQLRGRCGNAKSYAERLFDYPEIGPLASDPAWPRYHQSDEDPVPDQPTLAPLRSALIEKGMIYSPNHGDTAFTVPLFDEFMRRIMPGEAWRTT